MCINRLIWIVVFLAVSSLFGFLMVECKPLSLPSALASTTVTSTDSTRPRSSRSSTSLRFSSKISDPRDGDEETEALLEEEDNEVLKPVVVRKYQLHSSCSGRSVRLMGPKLNSVRADAFPSSRYAQLTVKTVRPDEISISSDLSGRFLCFNRHGKLIMRMEFRDDFCTFHERTRDKYSVFQSSFNKTWFVGFGRDTNALRGYDWRKKLDKNQGCYNFMKIGEKVYESMSDVSHDRSLQTYKKLRHLIRNHRATARRRTPATGSRTIFPETVRRTPLFSP